MNIGYKDVVKVNSYTVCCNYNRIIMIFPRKKGIIGSADMVAG